MQRNTLTLAPTDSVGQASEATSKPVAMSSLSDEELSLVLEQLRAGQPLPRNVSLQGVKLIGQDLSNCNLAEANLGGADLSRANLTNSNLMGAVMEGAVLFGATLDRAEFLQANLQGADLTQCSAKGSGFGRAQLNRVKCFGSDLSGASFTQASLEDSDMRTANLTAARLRECKLSRSDFSGSTLRGADLEKSDVTQAVFDGADLRESRLSGLRGATRSHWIGADITNVDFCGAYLVRRQILDQNYLYEFRRQSRATEGVYWVWWATSDCGRSFVRWGLWTAVLALLFALAYQFVELDLGGRPDNWMTTIYFSVVTLTTLGYGDIVPTSAPARIVALAEVILGYVMLGGLLGIFANKMARRAE